MSLLQQHAGLAYLAVFAGVLGHASSEFVAVYSGVAGAEVSVWRFVIGSGGLIVCALLIPGSRDLLTPLRRRGGRLLLLSLFGVTLPYLAFHVSLDYATVIQIATLVTTMPIWVALANLVLNRVPLTAPKLISGACASLGVAFLLTDGYVAQLAGSASLLGIGLTLLTVAAGSTFTVLARPLVNEFGAIRMTALTLTIGAIGLWLTVGLFWNTWIDPRTLFDRPPREAWSLLTIGLWNTTVTMIVWLGGLSAVPDITRGSYLFFLKPVIAACLALAILGQPITAFQVIAIAVICGSVLAELFWPRIRALRAAPGA